MEKKMVRRPFLGQMPSPPDFLTRHHPTEDTTYPPMIEEHVPAPTLKSIDYALYQNVINERKQAEMSYAEIYAQYVEVVTFNQKLLKKIRIFERFRKRARKAYENTFENDFQKQQRVERAQNHQIAVEKAYEDLQSEIDMMRATQRASEEKFEDLLSKIGQAEAIAEKAQQQFSVLAEEFDNKQILLEEADRHLHGYRAEIHQLASSIKEWQDKYAKARDESLLLQSQVRDIQLKEAGVAALNHELANSMTKAQKQIFELQDRLEMEREESQTRIAYLEAELERFLEQKRVEALLEKSKKLQNGEDLNFVPEKIIRQIDVNQEKQQWNTFYEKWSHIIDGLTSHSMAVEPKAKQETTTASSMESELISETGDLEIL